MQKLTIRTAIRVLAGCAWAAGVACAASAPVEPYPTKSVRIIDGFSAGGSTDFMARVIGAKIQERFGQTVLVDNRPGAASTIGGEIAARAAPDGHTMFITPGTVLTSSPFLYPKLPYDIMKDFEYVTLAGTCNYVMLIHPSVQVKSVADLVALTKSKPTAFKYGSGGVGSSVHLTVELLKLRTGMQMVHVPYKGGAPAAMATAGGEVEMTVVSVSSAAGLVKTRKLNALAVTGPNRIAALPEIPTMAESGIPDYQVIDYIGLVTPAQTSPATIKAANAVIREILQMEDVKAKFLEQGIEAKGSTPEEYRSIARKEGERWGRVVKDANIPPNL
jgi:tripartite-type tricarboxylate transporter receptor subunit TctC